jgi:centrosomal protein CEP76
MKIKLKLLFNRKMTMSSGYALPLGFRISSHSLFFHVLAKGSFPGKIIGKCLLGLFSVLDISVFKGDVKALSEERSEFAVGELVGNIKAEEISMGLRQVETDVKERPEQPKSSGMVSHLSEKEQYLVIRVKKCENLAIADSDTGTSDPYLRSNWDGMVQFSHILKKTTRPVFNFNMYFPVRLVYAQMRTLERYRNTALKQELESKGSIVIQVLPKNMF